MQLVSKASVESNLQEAARWIKSASLQGIRDITKVRSACFVYDSEGSEVARYDKIHMFDVEAPT